MGGVSVVALEDPVERLVEGVTQIEVTPFGAMTYERALRSMLRQDPQVLMLGEVRDSATAMLAAQAAMAGHKLLCTMHADDPAGAIRRLLDMGVERHQISSALRGVVALRLLRRRDKEGGTGGGYRGRVPVAEYVEMSEGLRRAVVEGTDAEGLRKVYESVAGHVTIRERAEALVSLGVTDEAEVMRALGRVV
jgi:type II secretory ATPase GspE/PulE/Tfp pilus assembly ATPase PilB-like protein